MAVTFLSENANGITTISGQAYHLSQGRIWLKGEINEEMASQFASQLLWCEDKAIPAKIYLDTCGGDVIAGLTIIDMMANSPLSLDVICTGKAYSMGAMILACAGKGHRHILPHAKVMIHQPYTGNIGGTASNIRERADSLLSMQNTLVDLIADHTGHKKKDVEKDMSYDHFFTTEEAIKYGLVDDVWKG